MIEPGHFLIRVWILLPQAFNIFILWVAASWESSNFNGGSTGVTDFELMIFEIVGRNHSGVS